jgi:glutamate-5-semialdehyde dehydrogenase
MQNIQLQLRNASKAKQAIANLRMERKREILKSLSDTLLAHKDQIIIENAKDLERMDLADSKYDRLRLTDERIEDLASSMIDVSKLSDPTGQILSSKVLENGLKIEKKSVALGVVAVIYESRPNVTVDVAALCIQSGNVCLLRGGSDALL